MVTVDQLRKALCDYKSECERNESCTRCVYWNGNPDFFCTNLCGHRKTCEPLRDCINKRTFYSAKDPSMADMDNLF